MKVDDILQILKEQNLFAVIEKWNRQDDPQSVMGGYFDLVSHLYWKKKDISATIGMALACIQYGLLRALEYDTRDSKLAYDLRSSAKGIAYNLASFTWPGWDEPDLPLDPTAIALGLEAAHLNLELAEELDKGNLPLSRAHWMLGAQQLATGDLDRARTSFDAAERSGREADAMVESLLAQGFRAIVDLVEASENEENDQRVAHIKEQLRKEEDGEAFCSQLDTAIGVFVK